MTVKELKDKLSYYADDMEVKVAIDSMIRPLTKVTSGFDMDTLTSISSAIKENVYF